MSPPLDSREWVRGGDLKSFNKRIVRKPDERVSIGTKGVRWARGKCALDKHSQSRKRESFGSVVSPTAVRIDILPIRPGARVKQHAYDRKVERGTSATASVLPIRRS